MKKIAILLLFLMLSACGSSGSSLDGTYHGVIDITFKPNGKISTVMANRELETPYEMVGNKIKFQFQGGEEIVLTIQKDGSLDGGWRGKFTKI